MRFRLQEISYTDSQYERPNQKWVCGWSAQGKPCKLGPDGKGKCPAHSESQCTPAKEGDRWHCRRPDVFGGTCDEGPLPDGTCCRPQPEHPVCQPRRSIRTKRGRMVFLTVLLVFGALTLVLRGSWGPAFISPGELIAAHQAIKGAPEASHCAVCHDSADKGPNGWVTAAIGVAGRDQSANCMNCHFSGSSESQKHARFAHSVDPAVLARKTSAIETVPQSVPTAGLALSSLMSKPAESGGQMVCATCHREHRGRHHDLAGLSNTSCQICHKAQFESFSNGHPEFKPPSREQDAGRGGIRFDHASHKSSNFGELAFDCLRCHTADAGGRAMRLKPFSASCAGCHAQGKLDHHGESIARTEMVMLQLPEMDDDTLWPQDIAIGEELTPLMLMLLAGDDLALDPLRSLLEDADGMAIDIEDEAIQVQLVDAVKRLVTDLATVDGKALRGRIGTALGADPSAGHVAALAGQLAASRFAMVAYRGRWLSSEPDGDKTEEEELDQPAVKVAGQDEQFALLYDLVDPDVYAAEAPAALAGVPGRSASGVDGDVDGTESRMRSAVKGGHDPIAAQGDAPSADDERIQLAQNDVLVGVGDAIGQAEADAARQAEKNIEQIESEARRRVQEAEQKVIEAEQRIKKIQEQAGRHLSEVKSEAARKAEQTAKQATEKLENVKRDAARDVETSRKQAERMARSLERSLEWSMPRDASGWTIDQDDVAVKYRPVGHADPLFHRWLDAVVAHDDAADDTASSVDTSDADGKFRRELRKKVLGQLTSKSGGPLYSACLRCHSVSGFSPESGREAGIVWNAAGRRRDATGYGKFDHRPHMAILSGADRCNHCHQIASTDAHADRMTRGGFAAHTKSQCTQCHAPQKADDSCVNCHRYHFDRP